jgi:hypothetical protein
MINDDPNVTLTIRLIMQGKVGLFISYFKVVGTVFVCSPLVPQNVHEVNVAPFNYVLQFDSL